MSYCLCVEENCLCYESPPGSSRLMGYTYVSSYHGTPTIWGKLTDPLQASPHNIHRQGPPPPLYKRKAHRNNMGIIMVTPIPFPLFCLSFLRTRDIMYVLVPFPYGDLPQKYTILSPFLGRLLKAQETGTYKSSPPFFLILGRLLKK